MSRQIAVNFTTQLGGSRGIYPTPGTTAILKHVEGRAYKIVGYAGELWAGHFDINKVKVGDKVLGGTVVYVSPPTETPFKVDDTFIFSQNNEDFFVKVTKIDLSIDRVYGRRIDPFREVQRDYIDGEWDATGDTCFEGGYGALSGRRNVVNL